MKADKLTVSFPQDLGDAVRGRRRAGRRGLSAGLADAAATKLRAEALAEFLDDYETEHGAFTAEELARASADLGLPAPAAGRTGRVSALILDAGALLAADRGERETVLRLRRAQQEGLALRSSGVVVAQIWRDPGGHQANLARLLQAVDVRAVDERLGREAGELLGGPGVMTRSRPASWPSPRWRPYPHQRSGPDPAAGRGRWAVDPGRALGRGAPQPASRRCSGRESRWRERIGTVHRSWPARPRSASSCVGGQEAGGRGPLHQGDRVVAADAVAGQHDPRVRRVARSAGPPTGPVPASGQSSRPATPRPAPRAPASSG